MKYIMFEVPIGPQKKRGAIKQRVPIIFPSNLVHADVAKALQGTLQLRKAKVISAGDLHIGAGVHCSGKSEMMGVKARAIDSTIIRLHDYQHGL